MTVLVFDTETTGLVLHPSASLDKQPRIIEFGAAFVSCKTGKVVREMDIIINPLMPISAEITKITGISDDDVFGKPTFEEAWPQIEAAFNKCDFAIAHNAPFDIQIIRMELERIGFPKHFYKRCEDTIGLYRADFGYDMKLVELYEGVTGKKLDQKHRALSDVQALVEIVQAERLWAM